jgi:hypothetical protein
MVVSGVVGWTIVWLLGDWLGSRYNTVTFFAILGIIVGTGVFSFYYTGEAQSALLPFAMFCGIVVTSFVAAMMLTGRVCRQRFTPWRFGLWLLLWTGVVSLALPLFIFVAVNLIAGSPFIPGLIIVPIMAASVGGIVYLVNLPFLILALNNPFYRQRLETMFRITQHSSRHTPCAENHGGHTECACDIGGQES